MSQFTIGIIITLTVMLVINFIIASFLKSTFKTTVRDNPWLKYIFVIPPISAIIFFCALLWSGLSAMRKIIVSYFND